MTVRITTVGELIDFEALAKSKIALSEFEMCGFFFCLGEQGTLEFDSGILDSITISGEFTGVGFLPITGGTADSFLLYDNDAPTDTNVLAFLPDDPIDYADLVEMTLGGLVRKFLNQKNVLEGFSLRGTSYDLRGGNDEMTYRNGGEIEVFGGKGRDTITILDGTGALFGNEGKDRLEGGENADKLNGGDKRDILLGNGGNDIINGDAGSDILRGRDGDDVIDGGADADHIRGGDGNDTIDGGDGFDRIRGGDGDDTIKGGKGTDIIDGGEGNDRINSGKGIQNFIAGGAGRDLIGLRKEESFDVIVFFAADDSVPYDSKKDEDDLRDRIVNFDPNADQFAFVDAQLPILLDEPDERLDIVYAGERSTFTGREFEAILDGNVLKIDYTGSGKVNLEVVLRGVEDLSQMNFLT